MINDAIISLFKLVKEESELKRRKPVKAGYKFEDITAERIYEHVKEHQFDVLPPRSHLNAPTLSGLKHQFDCILRDEETYYVIECKRRKLSTKDQILSFNSRILDYALAAKHSRTKFKIKGIFLSIAKISDNVRLYAFAYGIIPIVPSIPPIEYMLKKIEEDNFLKRKLSETQRKLLQTEILAGEIDARQLLNDYKYCFQLWRDHGYG